MFFRVFSKKTLFKKTYFRQFVNFFNQHFMNKAIKLLKDSPSARWIVLLCLSIPMFSSYFFDDLFTSIGHIFKHPELVDLAWNSADYGMYGGAYSILCVWGGLVICGMLLDKWGVKFTGSLFLGLMVIGSLLVVYALSGSFAESALSTLLAKWFSKPSLALAYAGCAVFGLGSEIAGVAVTRSLAKWFKNKEMALAMGLQLAVARLGTATAILLIPRLVNTNEYVSYASLGNATIVAVFLMGIAVIVWSLFIGMDIKFDKQAEDARIAEDKPVVKDNFKFSDIFTILTNKYYILISLLCVFFYCCIISFRKFATSIIIPRFDIDSEIASWMVSMIPFCTLIFTPLFGVLVDRLGKGTKLMVLGSFLVLSDQLIIAFAPGAPLFGYLGIGILGIGYSLVPAAMWPSVPKIIPEKNLGTAYSLIYWIQNMGMLVVPMIVGAIISNTLASNAVKEVAEIKSAMYSEYLFIGLAIVAVAVSLILSNLSNKNPHMRLDIPNKK